MDHSLSHSLAHSVEFYRLSGRCQTPRPSLFMLRAGYAGNAHFPNPGKLRNNYLLVYKSLSLFCNLLSEQYVEELISSMRT